MITLQYPNGECTNVFRVQKQMCASCVYRGKTNLTVKELEDNCYPQPNGDFLRHVKCHHTNGADVNVCCRGFWNKNKDKFETGRLAQEHNSIEEVERDVYQGINPDQIELTLNL